MANYSAFAITWSFPLCPCLHRVIKKRFLNLKKILISKTASHYVAPTGLKHTKILLPQTYKGWDYTYVPLCSAQMSPSDRDTSHVAWVPGEPQLSRLHLHELLNKTAFWDGGSENAHRPSRGQTLHPNSEGFLAHGGNRLSGDSPGTFSNMPEWNDWEWLWVLSEEEDC